MAEAEPPGDGGHYLRKRQLELRVVHLRVVRLDRPLDLLDQRLLSRELLPGNELPLEEGTEVLQVGAGVGQPGLVLGPLRFGLRQRHLVGTRIDFRQDLTRLYPLTFLEVDADELAVQSAAHDHRVDRRHRAECLQGNSDTSGLGLDHTDRRPLGTAAAAAAPALLCRIRPRRCRIARRGPRHSAI